MPVMLVGDLPATIGVARTSWEVARAVANGDAKIDDPLFLSTLGISDAERAATRRLHAQGSAFDPVVAAMVGATSGTAYNHLRGRATPYPIPILRFPTPGPGRLLDIGCNWGRWTVAAARAGHCAVGIDPQLGAVLAARRVARELGADAKYVVADARRLPLRAASFDYAWSYSVLQHFADQDVTATLAEVGRVVRPAGAVRIQMANVLGLRNFYQLARRRGRPPTGFDVRYRTRKQLAELFAPLGGKTIFAADCFFGLGLQLSDFSFLRTAGRSAVVLSELLTHLSQFVTPLGWFADSLFCTVQVPSGQAEMERAPL